MSKSRKNYPVANDLPKGGWKHEYNGKFRSKTKQLLNQIVDGKLDAEDLLLPIDLEEFSEIAVSPKEQTAYWNFELQDSFLNEAEETLYYERLADYEKSFRK
jgi:hypothetical protein